MSTLLDERECLLEDIAELRDDVKHVRAQIVCAIRYERELRRKIRAYELRVLREGGAQ